MPSKKPQNLKTIEQDLSGHIEALNGVSPGLGHLLQSLFTQHGNLQAAQAGHKGPVAIAKQTGKDARKIADPGLVLSMDRIAGVDFAKDNNDAVPLAQVRALIKDATDGINERGASPPQKPFCQSPILGHPITQITGCTAIYATRTLLEFTYVAGEDSGTPLFEVYVEKLGNVMERVGVLNQSEIFTVMVNVGHYLIGGVTAGGSSNLTIIDATRPNAPVELPLFGVGSPIRDIDGDEGLAWIALACDAGAKLVDCSLPSAPVVLSTST